MTLHKKVSDEAIERRLIKDANDPDAWEEPISVPASRAPRPHWYGRTKRFELAELRFRITELEAQLKIANE